MKMSRRWPAFLAVIGLGLLSTILFQMFLASYTQKVKVVIVKRDVPSRMRVASDQIRIGEVFPEDLHPQAVRDPAEIIGRYTLTPLFQGEQVLRQRLIHPGQDGLLAGRLAPGERAVAIPVDLVKSVGGLIDVGDRVDLLVSFKETTTGWSSTRQMLSRLRVLEVRDAQGFTVIPKKRAEGDFERSVPAAVVLAATPSEVEQIVHYLENGQIYLALDPLEVESDGGQPSVP